MSNNPKLNFPENWLYEEARQLFMSPEVVKADSVEVCVTYQFLFD
jgi:hypothetical protein